MAPNNVNDRYDLPYGTVHAMLNRGYGNIKNVYFEPRRRSPTLPQRHTFHEYLRATIASQMHLCITEKTSTHGPHTLLGMYRPDFIVPNDNPEELELCQDVNNALACTYLDIQGVLSIPMDDDRQFESAFTTVWRKIRRQPQPVLNDTDKLHLATQSTLDAFDNFWMKAYMHWWHPNSTTANNEAYKGEGYTTTLVETTSSSDNAIADLADEFALQRRDATYDLRSTIQNRGYKVHTPNDLKEVDRISEALNPDMEW